MKVYNLCCHNDHRFEGWFGSADDFDAQSARGLLECPMCGDKQVRKLPSAPRLNLSSASSAAGSAVAKTGRGGPGGDAAGEAPGPAAPGPDARPLQALWLKMVRQVMASTEDVGNRFAEEARRIHHKEAPERGIRGVATPEQAAELADEGIEVFALPLPKVAKEPLQ